MRKNPKPICYHRNVRADVGSDITYVCMDCGQRLPGFSAMNTSAVIPLRRAP